MQEKLLFLFSLLGDVELRNCTLQGFNAILPELRNLFHIQPRQPMHNIFAPLALTSHRERCHSEAHIFRAINELEDGSRGFHLRLAVRGGRSVVLVDGVVFDLFTGLHAQHACVTSWPVCVAFTERTEKFGEQIVWCLKDC